MTEEEPNIDLDKFRTYKKQRPKRLIRNIIYTVVLFIVVFYGIKFLEELIPKSTTEQEIEIEYRDSVNTQL